MTEQPDDYLVTSDRDEQCIWCKTTVPAGFELELIVEREHKRWYSCAGCAAETRETKREVA